MPRRNRTTERLVAVFLFGLALLTPPVMLVFDQRLRVAGIPLLYLYLFAAWALLIALAAAATRRIDPAHNASADQRDAGSRQADRPAEGPGDA